MFYIKKTIVLFFVLLMIGCASKLPEVSKVDKNYQSLDVDTYSVEMNCENVLISDLPSNFAESYCQILEGNIKLAILSENSYWKYDKKNPDLVVKVNLEQIHGGSASARFWIGFGAGRSVTTVYTKVLKENKIIAERRFNETTTMPNMITSNWSNKDAITQDAPLVAKKISQFVSNPTAYENKNSKNKTNSSF